jgi:hypothetical protein
MTTAFYTLLFVTYISIGEAAIIFFISYEKKVFIRSLFHYK